MVWDTGIGIRADDLPQLFQPFVQIDSRLSRQYKGTGLGLALVLKLLLQPLVSLLERLQCQGRPEH